MRLFRTHSGRTSTSAPPASSSTWPRADADEWAKVYTQIFPPYQLLIESYRKAREVESKAGTLDSARS
ncbi:hypothetical protein BN1110_02732 [bacterium YEK0313]|nr:hypothetical protein BN1110_02732 [bacterium YEK0313]